jgi:ferredoxin
MKIKNSSLIFAAFLAIFAVLSASEARASFPTLTLSTSGSSVQAIVSNADPNSTVMLFYPSGSTSKSVNIGTTNSNGYLTAPITGSTYGITTGNPVYAVVNQGHSATATWPAVSSASTGQTLYLTQNSVTIGIAQTSNITASNVVGTLSVPGNTNPNAITASANGNNISVYGVSAGTGVVTVCDTSSGCVTVNVTVQPADMMSPPVYLNPNNPTITAGQGLTVSITGYASGPYYISNNTGSNFVSTAISGNSLILTGLSSGTSNITVCAAGGQCGSMLVIISGSATTASNVAPALSSLTFSSNNAGSSFVGAGTSVAVVFNLNQPVSTAQVKVNGNQILLNGSGTGPYTANYTVTGNESQPIPVVVSFTNASGLSGQASFWIGNGSAPAPVASTPSTSSTPAASSYAFNRYLYMGMTELNIADPDVKAMQLRLKADGLYNGPITGYFGPQTKTALVAYQKKHGLSTLGVAGPATRALLNKGI